MKNFSQLSILGCFYTKKKIKFKEILEITTWLARHNVLVCVIILGDDRY